MMKMTNNSTMILAEIIYEVVKALFVLSFDL